MSRAAESSLDREIASLQSKVASMRDQLSTATNARTQEEKRLRTAQTMNDQLRRELSLVTADSDAAAVQAQRAAAERDEAQARVTSVKTELGRLYEDLRLGDEEEVRALQARQALEEELQQQLADASRAAEERRAETNARLEAAKASLAAAHATAEELQLSLRKRQQLEEHTARLKAVLASRKALQQHQELTAAIKEARGAVSKSNEELAAAERMKDGLLTSLQQLEQEIATLRSNIASYLSAGDDQTLLSLSQRTFTEGAALSSATALLERYNLSS